MDYLQKLQKESEIANRLDTWRNRRKELMHNVSVFYNQKGESFANELEQLITKYQSTPNLSNEIVLTQLINS